jgi:hypothetical protein
VVLVAAIVISLLIGFLTGGSLKSVSQFRIRYLPLAIAAVVIQVLIFSPILGTREFIHDIGPYIHIATLLMTMFVMAKNFHIPGMPVVLLGALLNAIVIIANGGFMPSPESALEDAGLLENAQSGNRVLSNSTVADDDTRLRFLGDVISVPEGIPLANVYSIGDLVLAVGVGIAIVTVMHRRPEQHGLPDSETTPSQAQPDPPAPGL